MSAGKTGMATKTISRLICARESSGEAETCMRKPVTVLSFKDFGDIEDQCTSGKVGYLGGAWYGSGSRAVRSHLSDSVAGGSGCSAEHPIITGRGWQRSEMCRLATNISLEANW